jgi:thymidylate synthase ThyX
VAVKLRILDDLHPEDGAMLQALYSRSAESVDTHLEKVKEAGSARFCQRFLVNYGHKSIADCGSTTMFIEDVSMLAAKAIQDWPLYSGQETSSRYIDFAARPCIDPLQHPEILARWIDFYTDARTATLAHVRETHPRRDGEKEDAYEGAVQARTFDILRGFLPAGVTTQLSWHTNLRQAGDHLVGLTKHPLAEVRAIGEGLRVQLAEKYASSGFSIDLAGVSGESNKDVTRAEARRTWEQRVADTCSYFDLEGVSETSMVSTINTLALTDPSDKLTEIVQTRPRGCVLPHVFSSYGEVSFTFLLDFGSFRDIQRHRNGVITMPILTIEHGFEPWYGNQLPPSIRDTAWQLIRAQFHAIDALDARPEDRQYYIPLGARMACHTMWHLPAAVYVLELRSGKHIHPTLRTRIHEMIRLFRSRHPTIPLHTDNDPDDWTVRRGTQTITEKKS